SRREPVSRWFLESGRGNPPTLFFTPASMGGPEGLISVSPRVLRGVIGGKMKSDLRRKTNRHLAEPFPEDPVLMSRSTCRSLALGLALLCFFGAVAFAQSPDCGILQGNASTMLPNF